MSFLARACLLARPRFLACPFAASGFATLLSACFLDAPFLLAAFLDAGFLLAALLDAALLDAGFLLAALLGTAALLSCIAAETAEQVKGMRVAGYHSQTEAKHDREDESRLHVLDS